MPDHKMLTVDTSELSALIGWMRSVHTRQEFRKVMYRAMKRTGPRVRTILRREVPDDYEAKPSWIGAQVGNPMTFIGAEVACTIPVTGARGFVGGGGPYKAAASAAGSRITTAYTGRSGKRTRRAYKVTANIVTAKASVLPSQGDAVHFMVFSGPNKGRVYARLGKERSNIRPAVGIGVPQMPTNRSARAVQEGIIDLLAQRIEHEHAALMRGYAK